MSRVRGVVVFVADQIRADHLGFGGGPIPTPHLDRLAAGGVVFDRAFAANPTCMPNRATLATGRWPMAHGTRTNGVTLDWDAQTFMRTMQRAGWRTAAAGKLHFQTMSWPYEADQNADMALHNPDNIDLSMPDAAPRPRPAGWDDLENAARQRAAYLPMPTDYYGFDDVDLVVGHGPTPSGHWPHWARAHGLDPEVARALAEPAAAADWDQVFRTPVPVELHPTSYVTQRALERLERYAEGDEAFLLFVSYPDPHHPFAPPGDYFGRFNPEEFALPDTFFDPHERSPGHVRRMVADRGRPATDQTMTWAPTEVQYRHALAAELGLIALLDDSIGQILGRLDDLGLAEDTAVVFTADHGDMFGDHGLMLKHFVHYRAVTRVPLVVRVPGGPTGRSSALVSSADLAPTLLDLGGLPHWRGIQGSSLVPLLEGRADRVRDRVLIEEDQPFGLSGMPGPVRMRTLLTDAGRLTTYGRSGVRELYDHALDPTELVNLADEVEGRELLHTMTSHLADELVELADNGIRPVASA